MKNLAATSAGQRRRARIHGGEDKPRAGMHAAPHIGRVRLAAGRLAAVVLAAAAISGTLGARQTPEAAHGGQGHKPVLSAAPARPTTPRPPLTTADDLPEPHRHTDTPPWNTAPAQPTAGRWKDRTTPVVMIRTIRLVRGDTLWALAIRYHTSVATLQLLNHLGETTLIFAGRDFTVPAAAAAASAGTVSVHRSAPGPQPPQITKPAPPAPRGSTTTTKIISFARAQLGKPYMWGGTGPAGFDCSGLVQRAYAAAGIRLPRGAADQSRVGIRISRAQLRPGDLVFSYGFGHVQLYIGDGRIIEAARPGTAIRIATLPPPDQVDAYTRIPAKA